MCRRKSNLVSTLNYRLDVDEEVPKFGLYDVAVLPLLEKLLNNAVDLVQKAHRQHLFGSMSAFLTIISSKQDSTGGLPGGPFSSLQIISPFLSSVMETNLV